MKRFILALSIGMASISVHAGVGVGGVASLLGGAKGESDVHVNEVKNDVTIESVANCAGRADCNTAGGISTTQAIGDASSGLTIKSTVHANTVNGKVTAKAVNNSAGRSRSNVAATISSSQVIHK